MLTVPGGRSACTQRAVGDFGHFEFGIDLDADALELAQGFELGDEVAQIVIFHEQRKFVEAPTPATLRPSSEGRKRYVN